MNAPMPARGLLTDGTVHMHMPDVLSQREQSMRQSVREAMESSAKMDDDAVQASRLGWTVARAADLRQHLVSINDEALRSGKGRTASYASTVVRSATGFQQ